MNIKINIKDFFDINLKEDDGFSIKLDFSNINVSENNEEFVIHNENDWCLFFED